MAQVVIIADDVTGACDTAVKLTSAKRAAEVFLGVEAYRSSRTSEEVVAIATNTRSLSPEQAANAIAQLFAKLPAGGKLIYKKVDSLLRGNIVAELRAAREAGLYQAVLLAPASPEQGRWMERGVLHASLADTVFERRADTLLLGMGSEEITLLELSVIHRGVDAVSAAVRAAVEAGKWLLLADAKTQEDLDVLAAAAMALPGVLPAGSAGLALSLGRALFPDASGHAGAVQTGGCRRVLGVVGSISPTTIRQIQTLRAVPWCGFLPIAAADRAAPQRLKEAAVDTAQEELCCGEKRVLIVLTEDAFLGRRGEISRDISDSTIASALAETAQSFLNMGTFDGLLLSGGDTAKAFFEQAGIDRVRLDGELLPGLVAMRFLWCGGREILAITKSGSFGDADMLMRIFQTMLG